MRAIVLSHAAIRASNRVLYRALAARAVAVTLVVPYTWKTSFGLLHVEPEPADSGVDLVVRHRIGISHQSVYGFADPLVGLVDRGQSIFYVEEDPTAIVAAQAAVAALATRSGLVLRAIQNIVKRYPPPFTAIQRMAFSCAGAAVSISDAATAVLERRGYRGPVFPMPFSTEIRPLSETQRSDVRRRHSMAEPSIGYVGRLVPEKGVDILIRALAALPNVRGVIVGDGPARRSLVSLADSLGVSERVRFFGAVGALEAEQLIGALDLLVLPSLTRPNWAEQFGRVLIEAMASGVPVVASDSGAIGAVLGGAGVLVPEGDPQALARALDHAMEPSIWNSLRERGLRRVDSCYRREHEVAVLYEALCAATERTSSGRSRQPLSSGEGS